MAFALPNALQAQLVVAEMNPGDSLTGEISSETDVDIVRIETVAGAGLTLSVAGKGKVNLLPVIELVDTSDDSVVAQITATKKKALLKLANADKGEGLPSTGTYEVRISGADGTTGAYSFKFTEKLPKAVKKQDVTEELLNGAQMSVEFDAVAGFETSITAQLGKKSPADPDVPTLTDPDDADVEIPEGSLKSNKKGNKHTLKKIALTKTGTHTVTVGNEGEDGGLRIKLTLKRGKYKKRKLTELTVGETQTSSLAGVVKGSADGQGLAGVGVSVIEPPQQLTSPALGAPHVVLAETQTDAFGNFVVQGLPAGEVEIILDGSSATNAGKAAYNTLIIMATVASVGASEIPQAIVLADLNNPDSATQDLSTSAGVTNEEIDAEGQGSKIIELFGPVGTAIMVGGAPADGMLDINVTPVPGDQIPMPLLDGNGDPLDGGSFVTVQPPNAEFDTSGLMFSGAEGLLQGLDITFPNDRGFAPGTLVDVWSFDHDAGEWVNRSAQTGQQGQVSGDGSVIEAQGVIVKGGWHAPVLPIDVACATTLTGRVVDMNTNQPVPRVTVATDLGQFASTDANGVFSIVSVPAYQLPSNPCIPIGVVLSAVTPVDFGGVTGSASVNAGAIVAGGSTDVGDILVDIPAKGTLSGLVTDNGQPVVGTSVDVSGAETRQFITDANGRFFGSCMQAGSYVAAVTFADDTNPTQVAFGIQANKLTTINVQTAGGQGKKTITVCVLRAPEQLFGDWAPQPGAQVTLVGSDAASAAGLFGSTNNQGQVTFTNVNPPYTITAQRDAVIFEDGELQVLRQATTVVGVSPKSAKFMLPLTIDFDESGAGNDLNDAFIEGDLTNLLVNGFGQGDSFGYISYEVAIMEARPETEDGFQGNLFVNQDGKGGGTFNGSIPSGRDMHLVLRQREGLQLPIDDESSVYVDMTTAAMFELFVPAVGPGETMVVDFDFADAIPFDREVNLQVNNLPAIETYMGYSGFGLDLYSEELGVDELEFGANFSKGGFTGISQLLAPPYILMPDPNHPALSEFVMMFWYDVGEFGEFDVFSPGLGAEPGFIDRGLVCDVPLPSVPSKITIPFSPQFPVITDPTHNDTFTLEEFMALEFTFDDPVSTKTRGFTSFAVEIEEIEDDDFGADLVLWEFLVPGGTHGFNLPPTAQPMIPNDTFVGICMESQSYVGTNADLAARLAGPDAPQQIDRLWLEHKGACEEYVFIEVQVGDPAFVDD
ncbi:MAG: hypothetical protein DRQ55_10960 [Planctomycetota bacterium]|nr:MAG: hypothetical protein DRQ55_10960 [Planctomycetota bacterium]